MIYSQETQTRLAMAQAGETDITMISSEHIKIVKKDKNLKLAWCKYGYMRTLMFFALADPNYKGPLQDIRVRQAIAYAIDTKTIAERVFQGLAEPYGNLSAPYHPGYDPNLKPHPYDPEKAKQLLTEAGYPKGFELIMNSSTTYRLDSQAIQASLSKVGINAKQEIVESGAWRKMLAARKCKGIGVHPTPWWNGRIHPAAAFQSTFDTKSKYTYHNDKELEAEYKKLSTMIDEKDIAKQMKVMTKMYLEKKLRINLYAINNVYALSKKIKYWENPPGRVFPVNLEYVTLNQ